MRIVAIGLHEVLRCHFRFEDIETPAMIQAMIQAILYSQLGIRLKRARDWKLFLEIIISRRD